MPRKIIKFFSLLICFSLIFEQSGFAQVAQELDISSRFAQITSSLAQDKFRPLHLRYLSYDSLNNNFKLLLDKGDQGLSPNPNLSDGLVSHPYGKGTVPGDKLKEETRTLLNYFFVGISLPNDSFWVNLRPDAEDQIIDDELGKTDMGKILLEADLQLKKDTAKFTSPETPEGKEYWDKLYKKAEELFGSENITIPTLTRPWIIPDEIIIRETNDNAYIYKATLKVMLEQDYLGTVPVGSNLIEAKGTVPTGGNSIDYSFKDPRSKELNEYSSQLIRELIIPKLTKDVNTAKRYASLRQVYYSLILAQWFKSRFYGRDGLYSSLIDRKNLNSLASKQDWSTTTYFEQYQKSFKDGEYNIKTPVYTAYGQSIRSYFSGGIAFQKGITESIANGLISGSPMRTPSSRYDLGINISGSTDSNDAFNVVISSASVPLNIGAVKEQPAVIPEQAASTSASSVSKVEEEKKTPSVFFRTAVAIAVGFPMVFGGLTLSVSDALAKLSSKSNSKKQIVLKDFSPAKIALANKARTMAEEKIKTEKRYFPGSSMQLFSKEEVVEALLEVGGKKFYTFSGGLSFAEFGALMLAESHAKKGNVGQIELETINGINNKISDWDKGRMDDNKRRDKEIIETLLPEVQKDKKILWERIISKDKKDISYQVRVAALIAYRMRAIIESTMKRIVEGKRYNDPNNPLHKRIQKNASAFLKDPEALKIATINAYNLGPGRVIAAIELRGIRWIGLIDNRITHEHSLRWYQYYTLLKDYRIVPYEGANNNEGGSKEQADSSNVWNWFKGLFGKKTSSSAIKQKDSIGDYFVRLASFIFPPFGKNVSPSQKLYAQWKESCAEGVGEEAALTDLLKENYGIEFNYYSPFGKVHNEDFVELAAYLLSIMPAPVLQKYVSKFSLGLDISEPRMDGEIGAYIGWNKAVEVAPSALTYWDLYGLARWVMHEFGHSVEENFTKSQAEKTEKAWSTIKEKVTNGYKGYNLLLNSDKEKILNYEARDAIESYLFNVDSRQFLAEFFREFVLNGPELRQKIETQEDAQVKNSLQAIYDIFKEQFTKEFDNSDIEGLAPIMARLGDKMMANIGQDYEALNDFRVLEGKFLLHYGISVDDYKRLLDDAHNQRLPAPTHSMINSQVLRRLEEIKKKKDEQKRKIEEIDRYTNKALFDRLINVIFPENAVGLKAVLLEIKAKSDPRGSEYKYAQEMSQSYFGLPLKTISENAQLVASSSLASASKEQTEGTASAPVPNRRKNLDEHAQYQHILDWIKDAEEVYGILGKTEGQTITKEEIAKLTTILASQNILGQILDNRIQEGDKIVLFRIPGIARSGGFGIKYLNDNFGYELTTQLISSIRKELKETMVANGLSGPDGFIYSTYKDSVFLVKNSQLTEEQIEKVSEAVVAKIKQERGIDIPIYFGISTVMSNTEEDKLAAVINANQAIAMSRVKMLGMNKSNAFYQSSYEKVIYLIAGLRGELGDKNCDVFGDTSETFLKREVAALLREGRSWNILSSEEQKQFNNDEANFELAQQYFELLNIQDYIPRWDRDFEKAGSLARDITKLVAELKQIAGDNAAVIIDSEVLKLLKQAKDIISKDITFDFLDSSFAFYARAPPLTNPVLISMDMKKLGLMNIKSFELELQAIADALSDHNEKEVRRLWMNSADRVTEDLLGRIKKAVEHIASKLGIPQDQILKIRGGDEITIAIESNNISDETLAELLHWIRENCDVRVCASRAIGEHRKDFSGRNIQRDLALAKTIFSLNDGIAQLKEFEKNKVYDTVNIQNAKGIWEMQSSTSALADKQAPAGSSAMKNEMQVRYSRTYSPDSILGPLQLNVNDVFLDLAGGPGTVSAVAANFVGKVIYADISEENLPLVKGILQYANNPEVVAFMRTRDMLDIKNYLEKLEEKTTEKMPASNVEILLADVQKLPLADNSITKLSVTDLFHWIGQQAGQEGIDNSIKEMLRVTKAGALLHLKYDFQSGSAKFLENFIRIATDSGVEINVKEYTKIGGAVIEIKSKAAVSLASAAKPNPVKKPFSYEEVFTDEYNFTGTIRINSDLHFGDFNLMLNGLLATWMLRFSSFPRRGGLANLIREHLINSFEAIDAFRKQGKGDYEGQIRIGFKEIPEGVLRIEITDNGAERALLSMRGINKMLGELNGRYLTQEPFIRKQESGETIVSLEIPLSSELPQGRKIYHSDREILEDTLIKHIGTPVSFNTLIKETKLTEKAFNDAFNMISIDKNSPLEIGMKNGQIVVTKKASSSMAASDKGGIDLRNLPGHTVIQRMPNLGTVPLGKQPIALSGTVPAEMNKEWQEIENMLNAGIIPSSQRIKEYLQACCQRQGFSQEIDKVLACLADVLRIEEERVTLTEPELREILVLLEQDKPANEMQVALSKIQIPEREPKVLVP